MEPKHQFAALVFVVYLSVLLPFVAAAHAVVPQSIPVRRPATAPVEQIAETPPEVETLIEELRRSLADERHSDSIKLVGKLAELGRDAGPAVEILISLLGKEFPYCNEEVMECPDKTSSCPRDKRICPEGAEIHKSDFLTPYACGALRQIGADALPQLSMAVNETPGGENWKRRHLAASVMAAIGPAAIPYLSDTLRAPDNRGSRLLALEALSTVVTNDPASGSQLGILVPYVTPFLEVHDFEATDQAINILGAIGPGAAEAVPQLVPLLNYKRELEGFGACPVGERLGFIFREETITALVKIGTPEALNAAEQCKRESIEATQIQNRER